LDGQKRNFGEVKRPEGYEIEYQDPVAQDKRIRRDPKLVE
jgi:hypothetical protein